MSYSLPHQYTYIHILLKQLKCKILTSNILSISPTQTWTTCAFYHHRSVQKLPTEYSEDSPSFQVSCVELGVVHTAQSQQGHSVCSWQSEEHSPLRFCPLQLTGCEEHAPCSLTRKSALLAPRAEPGKTTAKLKIKLAFMIPVTLC